MEVEWTLAAQTFFDQLQPPDRARATHAIERASHDWDGLPRELLHMLSEVGHGGGELYDLRVGADLRVILERCGQTIRIVDIVQRRQIDALRDLAKSSRVVAE